MLDRFLYLNWRKIAVVVGLWFACVLLHNLIYGLFREFYGPNGDEAFFFILAIIVIPIYSVVAIVYTLFRLVGQAARKN